MRLSGNRRYSPHNWGETRKTAPNQVFYKCGLITPTLEVVGSNPVSRTNVRRTQFRSVSAVSVRAAKTPHPLRPSSFPKRRTHGGSPFRFYGGCVRYEHSDHVRRSLLHSASPVSVRAAKGSISAVSFFLSETEDSRGSSVLVFCAQKGAVSF